MDLEEKRDLGCNLDAENNVTTNLRHRRRTVWFLIRVAEG